MLTCITVIVSITTLNIYDYQIYSQKRKDYDAWHVGKAYNLAFVARIASLFLFALSVQVEQLPIGGASLNRLVNK